MRLPGTRYQEHGWELVRKLLGRCSLHVFARLDLTDLLEPSRRAALLDEYGDALAAALCAQGAREDVPGNSYGESVRELAMSLACELQAHPVCWDGFANAVAAERADLTDACLRKKVNDMFAGLRDKVDSDHYQVACGRVCSPNKMYTFRMLDTAYHEIARLFAGWRENAAQVAAILGREPVGIPIEVCQMQSVGHCRAEWIMRWSATLERFGGSPGPLHTRSKRFASLKQQPEKIATMLREIADYEQLSSNQDQDWQHDADEAAHWIDDYWRVIHASAQTDDAHTPDQILPEPVDEFADADAVFALSDDAVDDSASEPIAASVSLPPRFVELARAAQDSASWTMHVLSGASLPVRLAVFQKLLGAQDDSYPDQWCDPHTGALPTMAQLAALDQVSLPTLRKRRNEAIDRLSAAARQTGGRVEPTRQT